MSTLSYTVKGKGWSAHWETRSAPDRREVKPTRKGIAAMHAVHRAAAKGGQ